MQLYLNIKGRSSGKTTTITVSTEDLTKNLLLYLQEKKIPMASSCRGEGICRKCIINTDNILSCQFTVKEYLEKIGNQLIVNYL